MSVLQPYLIHAAARALVERGFVFWLGRRWRCKTLLWAQLRQNEERLLTLGMFTLGLCTFPWHARLALASGVALMGGAILIHLVAMLFRALGAPGRWLCFVSPSELLEKEDVFAILLSRMSGPGPLVFQFEWRIGHWLYDPARMRDRVAAALDDQAPKARSLQAGRRL